MPLDTQDSNAAAASQAATPLPDSEASSKSGQAEPEEQSAGKQLETARLAVPVAPQESNAAASEVPSSVNHQSGSETDQATHEADKAGKQLESAYTAVPVNERESNLAASQTPSSESKSKVMDRKYQDHSAAGKELETAQTAVPPGTKASNAAASQAPAVQSRQLSHDVQGSGMQTALALAASHAMRLSSLRHALLHLICCVIQHRQFPVSQALSSIV